MPVTVNVRNNNPEQALKIFKTQVARSGTLTKARERAEYKKPGVKRREEKKKNTINSRKNSKNRY